MLAFLIGMMVMVLMLYLIFGRKYLKWNSHAKRDIPKEIDRPIYKYNSIQRVTPTPYVNPNAGIEFARKKRSELQEQLKIGYLDPNDLVRYNAMIEVLTQVIEAK